MRIATRAALLVGALAAVFSVALFDARAVRRVGAVPQYHHTTFACAGVALYLDHFEDAAAPTTWAHWGVPDHTGYRGVLFASTRVRVTYLEDSAGTIVVNRAAAAGQQEVTCSQAFSGSVARVVLLAPVPAAPSHVLWHAVGTPAAPGVYRDWLVRSVANGPCFAASPEGQDTTILNFCADRVPQLWDRVTIDYEAGQPARVTVRGTLAKLH